MEGNRPLGRWRDLPGWAQSLKNRGGHKGRVPPEHKRAQHVSQSWGLLCLFCEFFSINTAKLGLRKVLRGCDRGWECSKDSRLVSGVNSFVFEVCSEFQSQRICTPVPSCALCSWAWQILLKVIVQDRMHVLSFLILMTFHLFLRAHQLYDWFEGSSLIQIKRLLMGRLGALRMFLRHRPRPVFLLLSWYRLGLPAARRPWGIVVFHWCSFGRILSRLWWPQPCPCRCLGSRSLLAVSMNGIYFSFCVCFYQVILLRLSHMKMEFALP